MENGKLNVMHYDRCEGGCARLIKNSKTIKNASNGRLELILKEVNGPKKFGSEANAEEMLMVEEKFPFDAIIINKSAFESDEVLSNALFALEYHEIPIERLIYLHQGEYPKELTEQGATLIKANGGNSNLLPENAQQIVQTLQGFYNPK